MKSPQYFDIHSHLNFSQFDDDREELIDALRENDICTITVGTNLQTSEEAVALANQHEHLFATIGIHPSDEVEIFDEMAYEEFVKNKNVVAIGECGLDYFRIVSDATEVKYAQKKLFEAHIAFAGKHQLPLMIHGRPSKGSMDAYEDILDILRTHSSLLNTDRPGNIHFYVGNVAITKEFLELGFTLSFDGPITFAREYDETIHYIPKDMIMAETDAPFAAPAPHRGKRNEPAYVEHVIAALADIRGVSKEDMRRQTVENALRVFNLGDK